MTTASPQPTPARSASRWRTSTSALCIAALLAGCATQGTTNTSADGQDPCSPGKSALVAGVVGGVIGGLLNGGKGAAIGAAAGAATGYLACMAYSVQTTQQKTAQQVEADYRKTHRNQLPATPVVTQYTAAIDRGAVQRGAPFALASNVEVVNGSTQPVQSVREELQLFAPDGKPINQTPASKPFHATTAGRYANSFTLNLPQGAPQGAYGIKTKLYVNEQQVASRDLQAKVVWVDNLPQIVQVASLD